MPRTTAPRVTHNDKVLARLRRGPATHLELYQLGVMAHSRIAELRRRGHVIPPAERMTADDGTALYVYRLEPSVRDAA